MGRVGDRAAFAKYARLCALWADDPNAGGERDESDYLMADLIADFLESADSPRTDHRERYKMLAKLLGESGGELPVVEFGPVAFRSWVTWLAGLKRADKQSRYNRTTVGHLMRALRWVVKWGVSTERVEPGQLDALETVPGPRRGQVRPSMAGKMPAVDPQAVADILPLLPAGVRGMVKLQILTGARPSELCRMTVGEVLCRGRVEVPGVGLVDLGIDKVWVYAPKEHKTAGRGKDRWILFGPKAQAVLRPFLSRRRQSARAESSGKTGNVRKNIKEFEWRRPGDRVFPYSAATYAQAIRRACERKGVPRWTPYQLRRLAARQIDADYGREATAAALGHSNLDTSAIYTGRNFAAAVRVATERG